MRLMGEFKFLGVERRQGFKDPSKSFNVMGLGQGLDVLRIYVDDMQYSTCINIQPYTDAEAELDYNPVNGRMNLVELTPLANVSPAVKGA